MTLYAALMAQDEIYHNITYGERDASALEFDTESSVIVINSFSKYCTLPLHSVSLQPHTLHKVLLVDSNELSRHAVLKHRCRVHDRLETRVDGASSGPGSAF